MAYILIFDCMLQNTYEIGGNVKNCVILSKNALMTKLVTDGTRTSLVQFTHMGPWEISNTGPKIISSRDFNGVTDNSQLTGYLHYL